MRIVLPRRTNVTSQPSPLKIQANSVAIYPPPKKSKILEFYSQQFQKKSKSYQQ